MELVKFDPYPENKKKLESGIDAILNIDLDYA